ncbi:MAG TPA: hypothetical protein VJQ46_08955 [Gemmatimonadales bacterium]|nr:hypothetical protein [Gemmatimonadales bacterium]
MSVPSKRPEAAALAGGALVMLGAWLPWLTLFAGLQRYGGLIGAHGRVLFAGGALAFVAAAAMLGSGHRWIRGATVLFGLVLLGFDVWLLNGLVETLRHGVGAMLVPRAGPGLFVASLGIALVILGPGLALVRDSGGAPPGPEQVEVR